MNITDRRNLIKRTNISGRTPTINTGSTYPDTTWDRNDIMVGELYGNVVDDKLWWRTENGIKLINDSGSTISEFTNLTDTPSTYNGNAGLFLKVNSSEDSLEFTNITYPTNLINLNDTPSAYTGNGDKVIKVNSGETGVEFEYVNQSFTGLTDVNMASYTEDNILAINDSNEIISSDPSTLFVKLTDNQDIAGEKTFENTSTFEDGINLNYPLVFSGDNSTQFTINRITDTISGGTAMELPTALAVREYVNNSIYGSANTSNFVTIDTPQTIQADKTFDSEIIFESAVTFNQNVYLNEPQITTPYITGNTYNDMASYQYMGDDTTDGSWRWFINVDGDLEFQKRESGTWVWKNTIS